MSTCRSVSKRPMTLPTVLSPEEVERLIASASNLMHRAMLMTQYGSCGARTKVTGYEVSEVLELKPAEYFVQATKREKRACKTCEEQRAPSRRN